MTLTLTAKPLTAAEFAPYGDVIETSDAACEAMNSARFDRFNDLADVQIDSSGRPAISIARCRTPTALPYVVDMLERHPRGSQAFVPLTPFRFIVAVAPAAAAVTASDVVAFVTDGRQGVNYRRGVWHMPMIATREGQAFLIVDRGGAGANCDEHFLEEALLLQADL